jgi:hypothetical protein
LAEAELILKLCREFHCLPSQIEKEDANLIRLLVIESLGTADDDE